MFAYYSHQAFKATSPQLAATEPDVPRPPELGLLEELTVLGMKFAGGGYINQPWLLMQTLGAAAAGKGLFFDQHIKVDRAESVG